MALIRAEQASMQVAAAPGFMLFENDQGACFLQPEI